MAEYLIQDTTLSNIGNQIRILTDTEEAMSPAVMTSSLNTFNIELSMINVEQDNLIAQIFSALEDKAGGGGSSVIVGEITTTSSSPSFAISDAVGKDNVVLMYMSSGGYQASAMTDAGIGSAIVHGSSHSYTTMYASELYADSDDGFIKYDKTTGTISIASNMRYNETFIAGKYIYVTW